MAIDFPASPTNGQTFTSGNTTYTWDGVKWTATVAGTTPVKIEVSNTKAEVLDTGSDGRFVVTTEGSERLRVTSAGLVGIGTSNPQVKSHIVDTNGDVLRLQRDGAFTGSWGVKIGQAITGDFTLRDEENNLNVISIPKGTGRVGIGTSTPDSGLVLTVGATNGYPVMGFQNSGTTYGDIGWQTGLGVVLGARSTTPLLFYTNGSERFRCDSSGRLLLGTSSARANFFNSTFTSQVQIEGTTNNTASAALIRSSVDNGGTVLYFAKQRGSVGANGIVANGDRIATLSFQGSDGSEFVEAAKIDVEVDGTPGTDDMPGRLVFSTTADGASSPTERLRITKAGFILAGTTDPNIGGGAASSTFASGAGVDHPLKVAANDANFSEVGGGVFPVGCLRSASSAYTFIGCYSGNSAATIWSDKEFGLRGDGNGYADGTWNGGGADYAEFFEWSDSNPDAEDRRGISVVLDGDKIRKAQAGEDPIGVISGNPSVVGDSAWNKWSGKYLRDEFGTYIQEDYEVTDDDGNTVIQQRRKLNPAYNPDVEYISREQRPEWDCVGLMGKLRIRKDQVTGSRWIKMRDISDSVEEWLVR